MERVLMDRVSNFCFKINMTENTPILLNTNTVSFVVCLANLCLIKTIYKYNSYEKTVCFSW